MTSFGGSSQYLGGNRNRKKDFARAENFNVRNILKRSNLPEIPGQSSRGISNPRQSGKNYGINQNDFKNVDSFQNIESS